MKTVKQLIEGLEIVAPAGTWTFKSQRVLRQQAGGQGQSVRLHSGKPVVA